MGMNGSLDHSRIGASPGPNSATTPERTKQRLQIGVERQLVFKLAHFASSLPPTMLNMTRRPCSTWTRSKLPMQTHQEDKRPATRKRPARTLGVQTVDASQISAGIAPQR